MKRDFSEEAKEQLLSLVKQVEDEKWCDLTDWFGDRWYDFEAWIGQLDVRGYVDDVNNYHKKVIDKNNTNTAKIEKIFADVNSVSDLYKSRFISLLVDLREYKKMINLMSQVINPANGSFDADFIGKGLKNALNEYLSISTTLQTMAGDGLTEDEASEINEPKLRYLLDIYAAVILNNLPDVGLNYKLEIPIGPGTTIYYDVSGQLNGTGDLSLNFTVKDQQIKLKDYEFSHDFGNGLTLSHNSDGENSMDLSGDDGFGNIVHYNAKENNKELIGHNFYYEKKVGPHTFAYKFELDYPKREMLLEEKVTTDFDVGSVSSAIGIKTKDDSDWKPLPALVPAEVAVPYPSQLPEFNVDWQTVKEVGKDVAIVGVVVVGTGALIYFTGGLGAAGAAKWAPFIAAALA